MKTRQSLEDDERLRLAPYAQFSGLSAGRVYPEPPHPFRTAYQRDRFRIIRSRAFRRLANKTQVFLSGTGDHLRTRLTHTIEVSSAGRTLAAALGANEDLVECIALSHDLGHPPFGHIGESRLNHLMQSHGGFEHNLQSLRIVERLELKYPAFPGLNLSYEVREGLSKKAQLPQRPACGDSPARTFPSPSLEAQIADLADELTYLAHDLEDGLDHRLILPEQLEGLEIWKVCRDHVQAQFPHLAPKRFLAYAIRSLTDLEMADAINETLRRLKDSGVNRADDVRDCSGSLTGNSPALAQANLELQRFLRANLYQHPAVAEPNLRGGLLIDSLFGAYVQDPSLMGPYLNEDRAGPPIARIVCDYISGMTDRFLESEFRRICGTAAS